MTEMIDHARLEAIVQGSRRGRAEIIAEFLQASDHDALCLHLACESDNFASIELLAHRVNGACLMLGATGVAQACSLLALAGTEGNSADAREALALYDRECALLEAYLQALPEDVEPGGARADRPAGLCAGLHFVVAEDHAFQRDLIMTLLRRAGAQTVCGVDNGQSALDAIGNAAHAVDILLLDVSMPGMDIHQLLRRLGEARSPVAVILNSAFSPTLLSAVTRQVAGCNVRILGVVAKPLTQSALEPLVKA